MDSNRVLEWPSRRIPPGGVLHHPKSTYSQETRDVLKTIMDESKLTLYQQRQIDWCLRSGSSLAEAKRDMKQKRTNSAPAFFKSPPTISRRRSLTAIKNSGDFDIERFKSNQRNEDRELIKSRLQEIMEFGKRQDGRPNVCLKFDPKRKVNEQKLPGQYEVLQDLLQQIKERADWLEDMEDLGEGAKHREAIHHQIAERIRRIELMDLPKQLTDMHIDCSESVKLSGRSTERTNESAEKTGRNLTRRTDTTSVRSNNYNKTSSRGKKLEENIADILHIAPCTKL